MTTIRALIVDDEAPARELLRSFLAAWPDIAIVGEVGEGAVAVEMIRRHRPDLVFLDVQMPVMNGFDVVAALEPSDQPLIVFVTAHDQYALKAFDVSACDYLLKPFDAPRLRTTIDRVLQRRAGHGEGAPSDLAALLKHLRSATAGEVVVKADGSHHFLRPDDIVWIEAMGKSVRVHLIRSAIEVRESLSALEQRLDPARFVRISRSAIVNRSQIQEAQAWFKGDHVLILRNGARVRSGAAYRDAVRRLIDG